MLNTTLSVPQLRCQLMGYYQLRPENFALEKHPNTLPKLAASIAGQNKNYDLALYSSVTKLE
jgi:hypothetical protein